MSALRVHDFHPRRTAADRLNAWLALRVTNAVGSMWCAYAFAVLALLGLPQALSRGGEGLVAWVAQTFLQLVLLSVILVGQNLQAMASDHRAQETLEDAQRILAELRGLKAEVRQMADEWHRAQTVTPRRARTGASAGTA